MLKGYGAMNCMLAARRRFFPRVPLLGFAVAMQGLSGVQLWAQKAEDRESAGSKQEFEVASVREDKDSGPSTSSFPLDSGNLFFTVDKNYKLNPEGSLFSAKNWPLLTYIAFAYKLAGTQYLALRFDFYSGLGLHVPTIVRNGRYDIEARAPASATKDQMRMMMQSLLADRFKLAVHWETRQVPVFALVEAKAGSLGPQLEAHSKDDDCAVALPEQTNKMAISTLPLAGLPIPCGIIAHLPASTPEDHRIGGRNVPFAMLAESMATQAGLVVVPRPVIDETGLKGGFDFWMEWTPEDTSEVNNHETGGTFREALKNQLGLKLKPAMGRVQVLVIDHAEQVRPN